VESTGRNTCNIKIYLFPFLVLGKSPTISIVTLSKEDPDVLIVGHRWLLGFYAY